jgi:hypothetical protein
MNECNLKSKVILPQQIKVKYMKKRNPFFELRLTDWKNMCVSVLQFEQCDTAGH